MGHPAIVNVQRLAEDANNVFGQRAHGMKIRVDDRFEPVRVLDVCRTGVLVRPLGEFSGDHVGMIEWQVHSEVETLFQVAFCAFFEILGPEPLIAAIESADICCLFSINTPGQTDRQDSYVVVISGNHI